MTPQEAMKPSNHLSVKLNLELKRKHSRIYPEIQVGDNVKIFKKKQYWIKREYQIGQKNHTKLNLYMKV
jgi:hypothetical protein